MVHFVFLQPRGRISYVVSVRGKNVQCSQYLLALPRVRHDAPGQSLRHCAPQHVWLEEHLCHGYVRNAAQQLNWTERKVFFCKSSCLCRYIHITYDLSVRIQKLPRLLMASSDGYLYIYNVDPQDGGECVLVQKHRCVHVLGANICTITTTKVVELNL